MKKMCVWVVAFGLLVAGCAQETGKNRAVENVAPQERTVQPSKQSELTKGHTVVINIINAPSRGLMVPTAKDGMASVVDANKSPMDSMPYNIPTTQPDGEVKGIAAPGVALAEAKASFLQPVSGITINLGDNTASASQTPSVSTTRGAVSGSLTTSTNGTQEPQVQLVTPITFGMPGASVTGGSTAPVASFGGQATGAPTSSTGTPTANYTDLRVPSGVVPQLMDWLKSKLGLVPTVAPASAPAQ